MIPLTLRADIVGASHDFVCRAVIGTSCRAGDALLREDDLGVYISRDGWNARLAGITAADVSGDVLLLQPGRKIAQRLIRSTSKHNTFLITERCDQLCVMCSQPPKKTHDDLFRHFKAAAVLAPEDAVLGITGGEPTLYKVELFELLELALTLRPDLRFHVLTNAQHFSQEDIPFLSSDLGRKVLWGVPIYSAEPDMHDLLVGKVGAFNHLLQGLSVLCRAGAPVELRTVLMRANASHLPALAQFVATHVPFADPWAIMQLERIGYAKNRWTELFFDHSKDFSDVAQAIESVRVHGIPVVLYNFPLCTVPAVYRRLAPSTISDWKKRFEAACSDCVAKPFCTGFFEWHPSDASYVSWGPI